MAKHGDSGATASELPDATDLARIATERGKCNKAKLYIPPRNLRMSTAVIRERNCESIKAVASLLDLSPVMGAGLLTVGDVQSVGTLKVELEPTESTRDHAVIVGWPNPAADADRREALLLVAGELFKLHCWCDCPPSHSDAG